MSASKARNKRSLPSVPLLRSGSVDRMVTGTPRSTRAVPRKIDFDSKCDDVRKISAPILNQNCGTDFDSKVRSGLHSRTKNPASSNSSSNTSSPFDSPRISRKATVAPTVGEIIDKLTTTQETKATERTGLDLREDASNTEKKIARVLPMTPVFLEEHAQGTSNKQSLSTDVCESKVKNHLDFGICGDSGVKNRFTPKKSEIKNEFQGKMPGTPSVKSTPQQLAVDDGEGSSVRVAVRVRPLLPREENDPDVKVCITMKGNETTITSDAGMAYDFVFDYSLWSCDPKHPDFVGQEKLYDLMARPLLNSAFEGYNTCLFAYGQTGSGKSYSIMGQGDELGVLPRFCEELFERISVWKELQFSVEISYFEIYNEKIHDLLAAGKKSDGKKVQLRVREHPILGPFVQDLSTYVASSYSDIESWLAVGNSNRATAATGMNDKSSRSHSVFTIMMTQTRTEIFEDSETQMKKTSKINLIDLAGSERASQVMNGQVIKTSEVAALRLKEGGSINKSLHTLGKVISLLSDREVQSKRKMYIPYRDSTLTWLLKDSLGGNSKTAMIANISPASTSFGESLSTLRYAQSARTIVNRAVINEDPNAKIIRELKAEIERLKCSHGEGDQEFSVKALAEVALLREKLKETQQLFAESTRNWQEKLALTEKRKLEEAEKLKKAGISFKVDNRLPNLVNLNEDPQLSEMLLYMLKEGETTVGQSDHDIKLNGALVAESHCVLRNDRETVTISPLGDAPTYVNGQLIAEETVLHHGDRVVIGGDHYFRLNHPIEVKKRRKEITQSGGSDGGNPESAVAKDFEYARDELAQAQNARLQAELEEAREEARIQAQEEIVARIQEAKEVAQSELSEQKQQYEERVNRLQEAMESLSTEKKEAEQSSLSAAEKISELEAHRLLLEQEIINNRKKLQMEALAAKQALEETKMNQVRIITELEKEKKKMQEDVQKLKDAKQHREKVREEFRASFNNIGRKNSLADDPNKKELLRITMSLREANKISQSLKKHITFSRDDVFIDGKSEIKIRLNNTKKGLTTLWSLDKFESAMEQMRELYQQRDSDSVSGESGDEIDPFNDPDDKWEKDFKLDSSSGRRISSLGSSALSSRNKPSTSVRSQGFSPNKAESIFAKYRNQQSQGPTTDTPEVPPEDPGTSSVRPVMETSSKPPLPSGRRLGETRRPAIPAVSSLCKDLLKDYVKSFHELSDPFSEPLYEKVLRYAQNIKKSVAVIKNTHKTSVEANQKDLHHSCMSITFSLQMLTEHVRTWGAVESRNEKSVALCSELLDAVKQLTNHVLDIIEVLDGVVSNLNELFAVVNDDVNRVVRHTAKMAVIASQEEHEVEDSSVVEDSELNEAFVEGQDLSMETSVRESVSAITEIQEELQTNTIDSHNTEVEREITKDVLKLVRTTGDFIYQGRELQLLSTTSKLNRKSETGKLRLMNVKKFVADISTILDMTRQLAANTRNAYEDMDFEKLISLPEEIALAVESFVRQKRAFYEEEYAAFVNKNSDLEDELEYLDQKRKDVQIASAVLRKTLTRFLFLSTPKSVQKRENYRICRTGRRSSDEENNLDIPERGNSVRTPLSSRNRHVMSENRVSRTRKRWSKESPV